MAKMTVEEGMRHSILTDKQNKQNGIVSLQLDVRASGSMSNIIYVDVEV